MAFLVQMKQSNKCGRVRNDEIISLHLGIWCGPLSQHPLPPAKHQPQQDTRHRPNDQPGKKQRIKK